MISINPTPYIKYACTRQDTVVNQKSGNFLISSERLSKWGLRSLLYFCSTCKISSDACSLRRSISFCMPTTFSRVCCCSSSSSPCCCSSAASSLGDFVGFLPAIFRFCAPCTNSVIFRLTSPSGHTSMRGRILTRAELQHVTGLKKKNCR